MDPLTLELPALTSSVFAVVLLTVLLLFSYVIGRNTPEMASRKVEGRTGGTAALRTFLKTRGLSLDEMDFFCKRLIGLDTRRHTLVWIDRHTAETEPRCMDLKDIASCILVTVNASTPAGIKSIFLELQPYSGGQPVRLCFFTQPHDQPARKAFLFEKAQYWKQKIEWARKDKTTGATQEYVL